MNRIIIFLLAASVLFSACKKESSPDKPDDHGFISIGFNHFNEGVEMLFDTLIYINEAENPYMVNEIQYFISDVTLIRSDGNRRMIKDYDDIHYVDTDIPFTQLWEVFDPIPAGVYDSVSFVFGIRGEKNISFMYVNPPERDMFWPDVLGGGYHYLKLNGKWLPSEGSITLPFDFHLGIGQIYSHYPDTIVGFVQNWFSVGLKTEGLVIEPGKRKHLVLTMHTEKWFKEPNVYDHNIWGGDIMQNQEAMQLGKENGGNVFSMEVIQQ